MIFCKCGCKKEVKLGRWIKGHWNRGKRRTEEQKRKISIASKGRKPMLGKRHTEETKKKMSEANKGRKPMLGKHHSEETKRKMSEIRKLWKWSEEVKQKISIGNKGKHHSEETKQRLSQIRIAGGYTIGENNPNWRGGISYLPYCPKFNENKKEEIRELYNRKCYICNKDEKDNVMKSGYYVKLSIHHINMDKMQGCNGTKWKLIPLCMVCHGKIHFNESLQKTLISKLGENNESFKK